MHDYDHMLIYNALEINILSDQLLSQFSSWYMKFSLLIGTRGIGSREANFACCSNCAQHLDLFVWVFKNVALREIKIFGLYFPQFLGHHIVPKTIIDNSQHKINSPKYVSLAFACLSSSNIVISFKN